MIVIKIIIRSQVCNEDTNSLNQSFVLGDTLCEHNDRGVTIGLAIVWLLSHVILLLDNQFPWLMTNRVRLCNSLHDEMPPPPLWLPLMPPL